MHDLISPTQKLQKADFINIIYFTEKESEIQKD